MLGWLSIQGLALVDRIELTFDRGLNVLTGETGAGKSLILGSIGLLLGERADADWLRAGAERGFVEGGFELADRADLLEALDALGVDREDGRVVLRRELTSDGKSRALVNGRTVLLSQLRAIGDRLVDLHGQHEHQLLLRPESQAEFYDGWAALLEERRALTSERESLLAARRDLAQQRAAWERDREDEARVREELAELANAGLEPGEEDRLKLERERLRHRERLVESLRDARQALAADEGGAEGPVRRAARVLRSLAGALPEHESLATEVERLLDSVREAAARIGDEEARALEEPFPLEALEARLDVIYRLKRKHRADLPGLIALREDLERRARTFDPEGREIALRESALKARAAELERRIDTFLSRRESGRQRFEREVGDRLGKLGFHRASITIAAVEGEGSRAAVDPAPIPGLEFQFRPNPGEPARSLRRIASGGELSRVMLAVKSMMAERDRVAALVFDEVDQGIGGAVGEEVGRMLRALATRRQVLCITHLPLIAAHGARHFEVLKATSRGRTTTSVRTLTGKDREEEIARLLAGARVTETTRRQARELLQAVQTVGQEPAFRARRATARGA